MKRAKANPFDMLLGRPPLVLPVSGSVKLVINGRPVTSVAEARAAVAANADLEDDEPDDLAALELRRVEEEVARALGRAQDARYLAKAESKTKRREWQLANPEKMAAYREKYAAKTRNCPVRKQRQAKAAREYYARNREEVLAKARVRARRQYEAKKASKATAEGQQP